MVVCYRNPNALAIEIDALFSSMREISEGIKPILIMGDLNYGGIDLVNLSSNSEGINF